MYNDLVKQVSEATNPFAPMGQEEIAGMATRRLKSRSDATKTGVQVLKISIKNPLKGSDETAGMYSWWRNNQKWYRESPLKKVEDGWESIEFSFTEGIAMDDAVKTVNDFVADWAGAVGVIEEKVPKVGDMVYLMNPEGEQHYWRDYMDSGKITAVDGGKVMVRFHHHGNVELEAGKMTFDREKNSWHVQRNPEFQQALTAKRGLPQAGASVHFTMPKEDWTTIEHYSGNNRTHKNSHGSVVSSDENETVVRYTPPTSDYRAARKPEKQTTIPTKELQYNWVRKEWKQLGMESDY